MSEAHSSELERTLRTTEQTMAAEHRHLLQSTFYVVSDEQESLAV